MDMQDEDAKTRISTVKKKPRTSTVNKKPNVQKQSDSSADDKTRLAKKAQPADDKTQLKVDVARRQARPISDSAAKDDATVLSVSKPRAIESPETNANDRTQFAMGRRNLPPVNQLSDELAVTTNSSNLSMPILKERFVFEEMLGAGGMGMVYKAKDMLKVEARDRSPYVAIKVLGDEFKSHPEAFIALQRESRKSQLIAHPNIVNVFDFDKDKDTVFMTMELLEGTPLDKLINQYRATGIPKDDAWVILEGMCKALAHAHNEHIIHSDFKPGNIYITNKGQAKVFDFGIARAVSKAETHEDDLTDKTVFDAGNFGALTPAYASKEMLEGEEPDVTDDIYALGCIAYEMFTGKHPFDRVHANEAAKQKLKPVRDPVFSKKQWQVIESALSFKRADRVQTVDEFWGRLIHKKTSPVKMIMASAVIVFLMATIAYISLFQQQPVGVSEDTVRSQIEYKLRMEQHQKNINSLLVSLDFTEPWEANLWREVEQLTALVGADDEWLIEKKSQIFTAYTNAIKNRMLAENLVTIDRLLSHAPKYAGDTDLLARLSTDLQQLRARLKLENEQAQQKQLLATKKAKQKVKRIAEKKRQKDNFDQALANVNKQMACRSGLNMRDLDIAVTKLRQIDRPRYQKNEKGFVEALSTCVERIGQSFPARATQYKKHAMRIFKGNRKISSISIIPKDPCNKSLAGLGARGKRAMCYDSFGKNNRGPALVVIPSKGSLKSFAIAKYEVSNDEFQRYCSDTKQCSLNDASSDKPVTNISLAQAKSYISWLNENTTKTYRLPTKSEWIYAAKASTGRLDSNRNCKLNSRGIQKGNSLIKARVGSQNKWGLVNHVGNAQEFVTDTGGVVKVAGGSYKTPMEDCTNNLAVNHSGNADAITGFRVVREISNRS